MRVSVRAALRTNKRFLARPPKVVREVIETPPSTICTAREPKGRPGNLFLVSVTWLMQSRKVSALIRRIAEWAKLRVSPALAFGCVASW